MRRWRRERPIEPPKGNLVPRYRQDLKPDSYEGLISAADAMRDKFQPGREERAYWVGYSDGVKALRGLLVIEGRVTD